jgi:hypothetical protein
MAINDDLDNSTEAARSTRIELEGIIDAVTTIGVKLQEAIADAIDDAQGLDDITQKIAKSYGRDIVGGLKKMTTSFDTQLSLQAKLNKGQSISKELAKEKQRQSEIEQVIQTRINLLAVNDVELKQKLLDELEEVKRVGGGIIGDLEEQNTELIAQKGIWGNLVENGKEYLLSLDKSGLAAELLNGNLDNTQKLALVSEAAFMALAKAALKGSDNINNLQKNLGISYKASYDLQNSLAITAATSDKLYVTSALLNKAFTDLAEQTGIVSDFGGDTLVTMTALTKQLGLGTAQASQLALLARTQGEDTEGVLENTVATVSALNKQNGVAISAKAVLNDISTASKSIVVSLGMSPEILAEAATQARALGLSLSQVDAIAGSILDFESSIEKELSFELLTGKQINLEKARELALNNDLVGLTEELKNNAEITEAFATGNRIQQDAAAAAIGLSRDDLADMVYQQELLNLGAEGFTAEYGEQAYQSMLAQSASEKFEASLEKIKGVIGDIGTIFSPIIDGFAALVGFLAESKILLGAIAGIMVGLVAIQTTLAIKSLITAFATIFKGGFMAGPFGLPIAIAGAAALGAVVAGATQMVDDGIADSSRGPFTITDAYGKMAMTAKGDNLAVSPNINKGGGDDRMISLLEKIASKDSNVYMDSQKVGTSLSVATNRI